MFLVDLNSTNITKNYISLHEPYLLSFEWTIYITMEIIASQYQAAYEFTSTIAG